MNLEPFELFEDPKLQEEFFRGAYEMIDVSKIPDKEILSHALVGAGEQAPKQGREDMRAHARAEQLDDMKELLKAIIRTKK